MVSTKINLSLNEPYVRTVYAKEGDTGRVFNLDIDPTPTENGTLRIKRPDGVEVTADALKSADIEPTTPTDLVSFTALEEVPLTKLEVGLSSSQDLHGLPNPYPQGGYTNKCGFGDVDFTYNSIHYWTENGILHRQGTSTGETSSISSYWKDNLNFTLPSGTYYFTRYEIVTNTATYLRRYSDDEALAINAGSFTLTEATKVYVGFYVYQRTYDGSEIPLMIVSGSTAPTEYIPYSNICPIVPSNGKNLIDADTVWSAYRQDDGTFVNPLGTTHYSIPQSLVGKELTFSAKVKANSSSANCRVSASIGGSTKNGNLVNTTDSFTLTTLTITPTSTSDYLVLQSSGANGTYKEIQLELGSTATPYVPYQGINVYQSGEDTSDYTTHSISLGRSVYGGYVDLVSGKLVVDKVEVDMGELAWAKYAVSPQSVFYVSIADMKKGSAWALSSEYKVRSTWTALGSLEEYTAQTHPSLSVIYVRDDRYADYTSFRNSVSGVQLVYELDEPIEYTLTAETISTLLGTNNIFGQTIREVAFEYDGVLAELPQQATAVVGRCIGDVELNGVSTMPFTLVVQKNNQA